MESRHDVDHGKIEGVDVDIEISLKEYGIAWVESENEILFYYGIRHINDEFDRFDFCSFDKNIDIKAEFDWANFEAVEGFTGCEMSTLPLVQQIQDLNSYYGYENVFGSSYWEGLEYEEIIKT